MHPRTYRLAAIAIILAAAILQGFAAGASYRLSQVDHGAAMSGDQEIACPNCEAIGGSDQTCSAVCLGAVAAVLGETIPMTKPVTESAGLLVASTIAGLRSPPLLGPPKPAAHS